MLEKLRETKDLYTKMMEPPSMENLKRWGVRSNNCHFCIIRLSSREANKSSRNSGEYSDGWFRSWYGCSYNCCWCKNNHKLFKYQLDVVSWMRGRENHQFKAKYLPMVNWPLSRPDILYYFYSPLSTNIYY